MRRTIFALLLFFVLVNLGSGQQVARTKTGLTKLIEAESKRIPAKIGLYVKNLTTGEEAGVSVDEQRPTMSAVKVAILIRAYQLADQKKLDLNERIQIKKSDVRFGTGILRYFSPGAQLTLRDVITLMIIVSDNSATDIVLDRIGGLNGLNESLSQAGFKETAMGMTNLQNFRASYAVANSKYERLTPEEVFALKTNDPTYSDLTTAELRDIQKDADAFQKLSNEEQDRLLRQRDVKTLGWNIQSPTADDLFYGRSTPHEMGRLLEGIERGTIASKSSCDEMRAILKGQQANDRIPGLLDTRYTFEFPPLGWTAVAHKTGDSPPADSIDVGIVYAKSGPIIISFFANQNQGAYGELAHSMAEMSRMIVEYFDEPPQ